MPEKSARWHSISGGLLACLLLNFATLIRPIQKWLHSCGSFSLAAQQPNTLVALSGYDCFPFKPNPLPMNGAFWRFDGRISHRMVTPVTCLSYWKQGRTRMVI